ncbi:MAG: GbsR/MarR family transcriptional regulator [Pseudomonadota bacterium]
MSLSDLFADAAPALGLSRPAGLCLAAIWRADPPPCADDLCAALGLARSNVSVALRDLREWGLVETVRQPGDRKEYFTAPADAGELVARLLAGHRRRIVAPLLDRLSALGASDPRAADLSSAALRPAADTAAGKKKKKKRRDHG